MPYGGPFILKDLTLQTVDPVNDIQLQFEALAAQLAGALTKDNFQAGGMSPFVFQNGFYLPNQSKSVLSYSLSSSASTWSLAGTLPGSEGNTTPGPPVPRLYNTVVLTMSTDFSAVSSGVFPIVFEFTLTVVVTDSVGAKYTIFNGPLTLTVTANTQAQICLQAQAQDLAPIPNIVHTDLTLSAVLLPTTALASTIVYTNVQVGLLYSQAPS